MIEIQLPGIHMFGGSRSHLPGFYVKDGGFRGWEGQPDGRRDSADIPGAHGEFDLPVTRGPRVVTIDGYAFARTDYDLAGMGNLVTGVGADGELVPITVYQNAKQLHASGRMISVEFTSSGRDEGVRRAEFRMELLFPDPRKYGDVTTSREGEAAINRGNFPAIPIVRATRVSGSGGYTVTAGSGQAVVTASLAVGASHRIDLRTGGVYAGSTRLVGALGSLRPWAVPAAGTLVHSASAGIRLDVDTADTYM